MSTWGLSAAGRRNEATAVAHGLNEPDAVSAGVSLPPATFGNVGLRLGAALMLAAQNNANALGYVRDAIQALPAHVQRGQMLKALEHIAFSREGFKFTFPDNLRYYALRVYLEKITVAEFKGEVKFGIGAVIGVLSAFGAVGTPGKASAGQRGAFGSINGGPAVGLPIDHVDEDFPSGLYSFSVEDVGAAPSIGAVGTPGHVAMGAANPPGFGHATPGGLVGFGVPGTIASQLGVGPKDPTARSFFRSFFPGDPDGPAGGPGPSAPPGAADVGPQAP